MKLAPFDPHLAADLSKFYNDLEYSHFSRGIRRLLSLEELAHLPQVLGMEVLIIYEDRNGIPLGNVHGLVTLGQPCLDTFAFGLAVNKHIQQRGIGSEALQLIEDYVFNIKGGRTLITEILKQDVFLREGLLKRGYHIYGEIPDHYFVDGAYHSVQYFYKRREAL